MYWHQSSALFCEVSLFENEISQRDNEIRACQTLVEIFAACHISATHISAPKSLKSKVNTNIFFSSKWNIFWELRQVLLRYDKRQKFGPLVKAETDLHYKCLLFLV
jgi:hypothetical protein